MATPKEITAKEFKTKYGKTCNCTLLDVRERYEFEEEHIDGAKLIPLGQLQQKMSELPKDKPVYIICRSGSRSMYATMMLAQAGFEAYNIEGGMMAYSYG